MFGDAGPASPHALLRAPFRRNGVVDLREHRGRGMHLAVVRRPIKNISRQECGLTKRPKSDAQRA